jgi:hypothetical protein
MLQKLGDEVDVEEHSIARGELACVLATRPISISIDHQLGGGRVSQEKAKIQSAS